MKTIRSLVGLLLGLLLLPAAWLSEARSQEPKLHAIIVCDTRDPEIGRSMLQNLIAIDATLSRNVPASRLRVTAFPPLEGGGGDQRPLVANEVINRIRGLRGQVAPQDAVLLFYTGHGFYNTYLHPDGRAWGTCLSLSGGGPPLSLRTLRSELGNLNPRLSVLLIDCCNKTREVAVLPRAPYMADGVKREVALSPLFDQLFFQKSGGVILNSSKIGQYAFTPNKVRMGGPGEPAEELPDRSLFTQAWQTAVSENQNQRLDWNQFQASIQKQLDVMVPDVLSGGGVLLGNGRFVSQTTQESQIFLFNKP